MSTISPTASTSQEPAGDNSTTTINRASESNSTPNEKQGVKLADQERISESEGTFQRPSRRGTRETTASGSTPFTPEPLKKRLTDLFVSERRIKREPSVRESAVAIVKASWLNVLLVFVPIGWGLHWGGVNDTIVFVTTFLAIIPLAKLLGFGTEEIALRVGQTLGGLLNATLGNAVELIVAIIALVKCEIRVVQSSLLGSILSNLLLVLGMCFFAGGIKFSEQGFKDTAAQLNSSLLVISVIAVLIPAGYSAAFSSTQGNAEEKAAILSMSRGISIILLLIYGAYLVFQLFTHQHLYAEGRSEETDVTREGRLVYGLGDRRVMRPAKSVRKPRALEEDFDDEEEEEEIPTLSLWAALVLLTVVTVLVAITAEFLVSSINGLTDAHPEISVEWVGLILLPIVGNAAEHVTAVSVSVHDKLDLSMGVAVGSSIQIALFVIPFMVTLAWILNKPLSLLFDPFESIVLFLSVLITNYTIQDGRSNWLEGFLLMMVYVIIAVAFWWYPSATENSIFVC
ncbi:Sodium/calcium exchanger protein-domain-containing protein [Leucosporidium creatinivorum]|uniref:Vacuolar calcium ion transporter n=1 Tax=Leucosporidium creatinivorum TaxID=106004 RepID=A0A1Y2EY41_9BASI|nr:Sodium/calcium exchanger protein-domain-containing protein [Leucosporidium creatinivorum]